MPLLSVQNLRKAYGSTVAVDEVTFDIEPGEVFGLLGPNGAGKSTTISLCVGLLTPDAGTIELSTNGVSGSPDQRSVRRVLGVAPQSLALYEELTGAENLEFFGRVQGLRGADLRERVEWALDLAGLGEVRDKRVAAYSGGMKRRLNLAVAVIHRPQLVLLDEPTVGVDPQSRNAIFERVEQLRAGGCAVVYTTHYMEEAQRLCDRIAIIDRGRIIGLDTVDGLVKQHGGPGVLTVVHEAGEESIETREPVEALARVGELHDIETFRYDPPNLETVFLELTGRGLRD